MRFLSFCFCWCNVFTNCVCIFFLLLLNTVSSMSGGGSAYEGGSNYRYAEPVIVDTKPYVRDTLVCADGLVFIAKIKRFPKTGTTHRKNGSAIGVEEQAIGIQQSAAGRGHSRNYRSRACRDRECHPAKEVTPCVSLSACVDGICNKKTKTKGSMSPLPRRLCWTPKTTAAWRTWK